MDINLIKKEEIKKKIKIIKISNNSTIKNTSTFNIKMKLK
jgi:hypothetical protein